MTPLDVPKTLTTDTLEAEIERKKLGNRDLVPRER
jgi:hypothetical protein